MGMNTGGISFGIHKGKKVVSTDACLVFEFLQFNCLCLRQGEGSTVSVCFDYILFSLVPRHKMQPDCIYISPLVPHTPFVAWFR